MKTEWKGAACLAGIIVAVMSLGAVFKTEVPAGTAKQAEQVTAAPPAAPTAPKAPFPKVMSITFNKTVLACRDIDEARDYNTSRRIADDARAMFQKFSNEMLVFGDKAKLPDDMERRARCKWIDATFDDRLMSQTVYQEVGREADGRLAFQMPGAPLIDRGQLEIYWIIVGMNDVRSIDRSIDP